MATLVHSLDPSPVMATCAVCLKGDLQTRQRRKLYGLSSATARAQLKHLANCVGYSVSGENSILPLESDQRSFICSECFDSLQRAAQMSVDLAKLERKLENSLINTATSLGVKQQFPRSSSNRLLPPLEIVFSFDTTGSMHSCLIQVRQKITEMVKLLKRKIPGIRIAVIGHGNYCDAPDILTTKDFSNDEKKLCDSVKNIPKTRGGDFPACYELVLNEVRTNLSWTPGTQRSLVMIGDATPYPPTDPQNSRKLDWKVEAKKLRDHLGVRIYAVQVINKQDFLTAGIHLALSSLWREINDFYRDLASLTGGRHLHLNDISSVVDMLMAICLREQSPEQLQAYKEEVRKRDSGVSSSTQRLFDELTDKDITSSETRGRIIVLSKQLEVIEKRLKERIKEIEESGRKLHLLQEEHESRKKQCEEEWQVIGKELKRQQDQLSHFTDEVRDAYNAKEKRAEAEAKRQELQNRQKQLEEYCMQTSNMIGELQKHIALLKNHIDTLEEQKRTLEELESCGEKYTKKLTECDEQLKQLQKKLEIAQETLRSCEKDLLKTKEDLTKCLDVMNKCGQTLAESNLELRRSLDVLEEFQKKTTDRLKTSEERIWFANSLPSVIPQTVLRWFGYSKDQLESEKDELQKCSNELKETELTLQELKKDLEESVMELKEQKQRVSKPKDPRSARQVPLTDDYRELQCEKSTSHAIRSWEYEVMSSNSPTIIAALADNSLAHILADELKSQKLIGGAVYARATSHGPGITEYWRVEQIVTAMLSEIKHTPQRYYDFIAVLELDRLRVDAEAALVLLPSGPPVKH